MPNIKRRARVFLLLAMSRIVAGKKLLKQNETCKKENIVINMKKKESFKVHLDYNGDTYIIVILGHFCKGLCIQGCF